MSTPSRCHAGVDQSQPKSGPASISASVRPAAVSARDQRRTMPATGCADGRDRKRPSLARRVARPADDPQPVWSATGSKRRAPAPASSWRTGRTRWRVALRAGFAHLLRRRQRAPSDRRTRLLRWPRWGTVRERCVGLDQQLVERNVVRQRAQFAGSSNVSTPENEWKRPSSRPVSASARDEVKQLQHRAQSSVGYSSRAGSRRRRRRLRARG